MLVTSKNKSFRLGLRVFVVVFDDVFFCGDELDDDRPRIYHQFPHYHLRFRYLQLFPALLVFGEWKIVLGSCLHVLKVVSKQENNEVKIHFNIISFTIIIINVLRRRNNREYTDDFILNYIAN